MNSSESRAGVDGRLQRLSAQLRPAGCAEVTEGGVTYYGTERSNEQLTIFMEYVPGVSALLLTMHTLLCSISDGGYLCYSTSTLYLPTPCPN